MCWIRELVSVCSELCSHKVCQIWWELELFLDFSDVEFRSFIVISVIFAIIIVFIKKSRLVYFCLRLSTYFSLSTLQFIYSFIPSIIHSAKMRVQKLAYLTKNRKKEQKLKSWIKYS